MTVSPEVFAAWRTRRFGDANPARHDNPLWAELVGDRSCAYHVNQRYGFARVPGAGPTWCFDRFGRSTTALDDGRTVYIGGEHEDWYDPDFCIYNDVVIVGPGEGDVAIYGYPRDVFPPTDFHTATRDGDAIWIIGNLGYGDERVPGATQVCRLSLATLAIERIATTGTPPGWLHKHEAELAGGGLVVRGGMVEPGGDHALEENIDEWALDLATRVWTRRTALDWQRWAVRRVDRRRSLLWELQQLAWHVAHPDARMGVDYRAKLVEELGCVPDLAPLRTLYLIDGATPLPDREGDDACVVRVELDGVVVRFTERYDRIAVMVEGRLADDRLRALQAHVLAQLTALHATPWELAP